MTVSRPCAPVLLALALSFSTAGHAEDGRLVETRFDPGKVVKIEGRTNIQATIQFDDSELIENVAIGDSAAWQVTPNKRANLLFVKPLQPRASTNLTVVTSAHTYLFDLVASPQAKPLYVLKFTYPDQPKAKLPVTAEQAANDTELAAANDPYAVKDPAALNFAWDRKGAASVLPSRVYDDGDAVYLTWPAGDEVPAILIKNAEGTEGPVNYTVRGETVVVDGVPAQFFLRSGRSDAVLTNRRPNPPEPKKDASLARAEELR